MISLIFFRWSISLRTRYFTPFASLAVISQKSSRGLKSKASGVSLDWTDNMGTNAIEE